MIPNVIKEMTTREQEAGEVRKPTAEKATRRGSRALSVTRTCVVNRLETEVRAKLVDGLTPLGLEPVRGRQQEVLAAQTQVRYSTFG